MFLVRLVVIQSVDNLNTMIKVTPLALENLERLQMEYKYTDQGLRFGLSGGGCSGYKYVIEFEESKQSNDIVYNACNENYKIDIYVSEKHIDKLKNSTIDWKSTLMEEGFDIDNPQAKQPCGCGESINFREEEKDNEL